MTTVKYGDIISGSTQSIPVNVWASKPDPNRWMKVEKVVVAEGEKWYYATLRHQDETRSEQYLIHDSVGDDGWGGIDIYTDVSVVGHQEDPTLRVREGVKW